MPMKMQDSCVNSIILQLPLAIFQVSNVSILIDF